MKYFLSFTTIICFIISGYGQTLIWNDDFETSLANWNLNTTPPGGINDINSNIWVISDDEGGVIPPGCGVANNGNKTLHVSCQGLFCLGSGAIYNAGDMGLGFFPAATDKRAALNTPISTVGHSQLELHFNWIGVGQLGQDFAELEYSTDGGNTWQVLWTQSPGMLCQSGQGQWAAQVVQLPVQAENIPDLRFAFRWRNNNDAEGADPSFAVDELELFSNNGGDPVDPNDCNNLVVDYGYVDSCGVVYFYSNTSASNNASYLWDFGDGATSNDENPIHTYNQLDVAYNITLTVTDSICTDSVSYNITVKSCDDPNPNDCDGVVASYTFVDSCGVVTFTNTSTSSFSPSFNWNFGDGNFSSVVHPIHTYNSLNANYFVSLIITDGDCADTVSQTVFATDCGDSTNGDCSGFTAIFDFNDSCGVVTFYNVSIGSDNANYTWDFGDGTTSADEAPTHTYTTLDTVYVVTLTITDGNCSDETFHTLEINDCLAGLTSNEAIHLSVVPNPFTNNVLISANQQIDKLSIYSVSGQLLHKSQPNNKVVNLKLSDLASGVYLLHVESNGSLNVSKIIKQ